MADPFEKRIRRAEFLEKEWPFAAESLRFFQALFRFQQSLYPRFPEGSLDPEGYDFDKLDPLVPETLGFLEAHGGRALAAGVAAARNREQEEWLGFLTVCRASDEMLDVDDEEFNVPILVSRILMQPYLTRIFGGRSPEHDPEDPRRCPCCHARPSVSLLREDKHAETVRRTLVCSLCGVEWHYARVLCPACDEEKPEKLPRYTAQEIPWVRVEACDTCKKYLKSVDLTVNWDADPVVDELASTPLDVIARDHGYVKIAPNLAGI